MSMNTVIHRAVRRDLDRFVDALTAFPAGDRARAERLALAWENFDRQLVHHHEGEHEIAWPALEAVGVTRETIAMLDAEHEAMSAALAESRAAMSSLRTSPFHTESEGALSALLHLREVTVHHLDHEEREIEPIYLAHAESPELKKMGRDFAKVGPGTAGPFFAWLLDGATAAEKDAIRRNVPGPVLFVLTSLFGRRYHSQVAPAWN